MFNIFGNSSSNDTISWQPDPTTREYAEPQKTISNTAGITAYVGFGGYQDNLSLGGMKKDTPSEPGSDDIASGLCEKPFSTKQGFYINIGGLAFDTRRVRGKFLPLNAPPLLPFTFHGIERLVEMHPELLEKISYDEINDKSKKDGLGKLLVCFQVF
ncbi:hypothetical protein BDZ45DRAFT_744819 [Acephala macrosclerotiorum]|nr:hypothetical protein BDZ45DRAFT_744819 [Acephala macrosclerotiorum]